MVTPIRESTKRRIQEEVRVRHKATSEASTTEMAMAEITVEDVQAYIEARLKSQLDQLMAAPPSAERAEPEFWWDLFSIGPLQLTPPNLFPHSVIATGETAFVATIVVLNPAVILVGPISPKDVLEGFGLNVELQYRTGNLSTWTLAEPSLQIDDTITLSPGGGIFGSPFYINVQALTPTIAGLHELNVTARITGLPSGAAPFGGHSKLMFDFDAPDLVNIILGLPSASPGFMEGVPCRYQVYTPG